MPSLSICSIAAICMLLLSVAPVIKKSSDVTVDGGMLEGMQTVVQDVHELSGERYTKWPASNYFHTLAGIRKYLNNLGRCFFHRLLRIADGK